MVETIINRICGWFCNRESPSIKTMLWNTNLVCSITLWEVMMIYINLDFSMQSLTIPLKEKTWKTVKICKTTSESLFLLFFNILLLMLGQRNSYSSPRPCIDQNPLSSSEIFWLPKTIHTLEILISWCVCFFLFSYIH